MTTPEPADLTYLPLPRSVAASLAQLPANQRTDPRVVAEALMSYYAAKRTPTQ